MTASTSADPAKDTATAAESSAGESIAAAADASNAAKEGAATTPDAVKEDVAGAADAAKEEVAGAADAAKEAVDGAADAAKEEVAGAADEAKEAVDANLPKTLEVNRAGLLDPSKAKEKAPDTFKARFDTSKGAFVVDVRRDWSPNGADRFYNLVRSGFYDETRFFRVISGFMAQIGINGDPKVMASWREANIPDDPVKKSNLRGFVTFAKTGLPNSRSTQIFINFGNNSNLDRMGFAPIGTVDAEGMKVVDALYSGYGEGAPRGRGPNQGRIQMQGNDYLKQDFPRLDYVKSARILAE